MSGVRVDPYITESCPLFKKDKKSCVVMAWSVVTESDYQKSYNWWQSKGREKGKGVTLSEFEKVINSVKKIKIKKGPYTSKNRITINQFLDKHPKGRYICLVRGHAICIKDGVLYDHKESLRRQIQHAWRVYLNEDELKEARDAYKTI